MDDLISRKEAKDAIYESFAPYQSAWAERIRQVWNAIDSVPAVELPTWIPCSERLPEENRDGWTELVLSIKTGEVILGFWHDIETGFCRRFRDGVCSAGGVIAWMSLPEPYKGEQHETD